MTVEHVGVKLTGGDHDGHQSIYPMPWPPPEEIIVFRAGDKLAVADVRHEQRARDEFTEVVRYRKVQQSKLPNAPPSGVPIVRGASYEAIP